MNIEISILKPCEASLVWPLVNHIAAKELGFPEEALCFYHQQLTEEEVARRTADLLHVVLAARIDEKLVGALIGTPPEGGVGTILWLLVYAKWREYGIGRHLFCEACRRYQEMGCHKIKLTAPTKHTVRFYEKQGMQVEGFHANHWWNLDFWSLGKNI